MGHVHVSFWRYAWAAGATGTTCSRFVTGVALKLAFAVAVVYLPPLGRALGTGPIPAWLLGLAALGASVLFLADWLRKRLAARSHVSYTAAPNLK